MISGTGTPRRAAGAKTPLGKALAFLASLDMLQAGLVLFLSATGLMFIRSIGLPSHGEAKFLSQLFWLGVGFAAYVGCALVDLRSKRARTTLFLFYPLTVLLLVLVFVPGVGVRINEARRWINLGFRNVQPSEFAKLGLIIALSTLYSSSVFKVNRLGGLAAGALLTLLPFELIRREPDLGSAMVCLPVFLGIVFCAGLKWRYLVWGTVAAAAIGGLIVLNEATRFRPLLTDYQRARIHTFFHPDEDRAGAGYNAHQAKLAVGSGGFTGRGIGEGPQNKLGYVPRTVNDSDFIFSVIAEETGFMGSLALICGYMLLIYAILRTGFITEDAFGRLLCVGVATLFFTHMFINIGMNVGVMPITGLPLPLVSYGGSFTVVALAALGLVQAVHRHK